MRSAASGHVGAPDAPATGACVQQAGASATVRPKDVPSAAAGRRRGPEPRSAAAALRRRRLRLRLRWRERLCCSAKGS